MCALQNALILLHVELRISQKKRVHVDVAVDMPPTQMLLWEGEMEEGFWSIVPEATLDFLLFVGLVFLILFLLLLYLDKCCCFRSCQGYTCFDPKPVGKLLTYFQYLQSALVVHGLAYIYILHQLKTQYLYGSSQYRVLTNHCTNLRSS